MPCYTAAQTAIKMLYWSLLVYDHGEQRASPVTADTALLLYDLEHFEVFWEKSLDTKAVVGWNSDTVGGGAGGGCGRKGGNGSSRHGMAGRAGGQAYVKQKGRVWGCSTGRCRC